MQIRASFNQQDVERLIRSFNVALQSESVRAVRHIAGQGASHIERLERAAGHEWLAARWTTRIKEGRDFVYGEIYNSAEDDRFHNKTSHAEVGRVRSTKYPVEVHRVLAILEGGARKHRIAPTSARVLAIPLPGTESRTRAHVRANGPGSFLPPTPGDTMFRAAVRHPGVRGNRNIETTRRLLVTTLGAVANVTASHIAVRTSA